jgi:repressor LexA
MYSMNTLTKKQAEVYKFIQDFHEKEGVYPSYREIANFFGFRSLRAVSDHLKTLEKKGFLHLHTGRSRGMELLNLKNISTKQINHIPIFGSIPAGYPELQTEQSLGNIDDEFESLSGHRLFALKVDGESMEGRGILKGDLVIADADASPNEGNIVVALIDGKSTLKTLAKHKGQFYLKAENPVHKDHVPIEELVIQGVVKKILRRLD